MLSLPASLPWHLLLLSLSCCRQVSANDVTHIQLHKGWVKGNRHSILGGTIVHEYLGIPMGKPPIGEKRFRRPEPVDSWDGIHDATKRPNACVSILDETFGSDFHGSAMWNPPELMSEDCLYINAWVPNPDQTGVKKPIMIWIYGGGYYSGSSTLDVYDGRYLAASQNIIVVSMQYRLGMLGFLNLESELAPGNMGLLDQLLGIRWVQDNAEYLYGDKNNVTIFGESAGSVSVGLHLISPLSRDLFSRAIMQSGSPTGDWTLMSAENSWLRLNKTVFGGKMNCPRSSHVPTIMKCLLNLPARLLNGFEGWAPSGPAQFNWLPSVDYYFLVERPIVSMEKGNFKKCPLLIGSNANEGSYFIIYELFPFGFGANFRNRQLNFSIPYKQHKSFLEKAFRFYPQWDTEINQFGTDAIIYRYTDWRNPDDTSLNLYNLDMAVGDYHFLCPTNKFSQYFVQAGQPVYYYLFAQRASVLSWGEWMGVLHGYEIPFIFGEPLRPGSRYTEDEKRLSRQMMAMWANFSQTGNPNGLGGGELWPAASMHSREYYELSTASLHNAVYGSGPRTEYCAFWDSYMPGLIKGTADIHVMEYEWKKNFADWSNKYIVDWKHEYNRYIRTQYEPYYSTNNYQHKRDEF